MSSPPQPQPHSDDFQLHQNDFDDCAIGFIIDFLLIITMMWNANLRTVGTPHQRKTPVALRETRDALQLIDINGDVFDNIISFLTFADMLMLRGSSKALCEKVSQSFTYAHIGIRTPMRAKNLYTDRKVHRDCCGWLVNVDTFSCQNNFEKIVDPISCIIQSGFANLRGVTIDNNHVRGEIRDKAVVRLLSSCPTIAQLSLASCGKLTKATIDYIAQCHAIVDISFINCRNLPKDWPERLSNCGNIQRMSLHNMRFFRDKTITLGVHKFDVVKTHVSCRELVTYHRCF